MRDFKVGCTVRILEDLISAQPSIMAKKGELATIIRVHEVTKDIPWKYTILVENGHYVHVHSHHITELCKVNDRTDHGS